MSIVLNSPSHSQGESYFSPSGATPSFESNEQSQTPYFTAPLSPMLNTEFFQAVQARQAGTPPFISTNSSEASLNASSTNSSRCFKDSPPMNLNLGATTLRREKQTTSSTASNAISPDALYDILSTNGLLLLDVRSFVQYSHSHIQTAVGVSVPNTILRRPTFTLEKLSEAIVKDDSKHRLQNWPKADSIVLYDQNSLVVQEASTIYYLLQKFQRQGFKGHLSFLQGQSVISSVDHVAFDSLIYKFFSSRWHGCLC